VEYREGLEGAGQSAPGKDSVLQESGGCRIFWRFRFCFLPRRDSIPEGVRSEEAAMSLPGDARQKDLFRPALDQIIALDHPLVRLARTLDWDFLASRFAQVYVRGPGQPPLPTRLVAGLLILHRTCTISPTKPCARAGWRTRIFSSSAASWCFATNCPSRAPP
jgi:hypothetical protein